MNLSVDFTANLTNCFRTLCFLPNFNEGKKVEQRNILQGLEYNLRKTATEYTTSSEIDQIILIIYCFIPPRIIIFLRLKILSMFKHIKRNTTNWYETDEVEGKLVYAKLRTSNLND